MPELLSKNHAESNANYTNIFIAKANLLINCNTLK